MVTQWINSTIRTVLVIFTLVFVVGCSSSLNKVTNENAPTMKEVYEDYLGASDHDLEARKVELLQRPAVEPSDLQLDHPPYPARLDHLYPRLPNPDLFMYVRPHAVGTTGAPIPAYITRFSMYERQPYALPGETLQSAKILNDFKREQIRAQERAAAMNQKKARRRK